VSRIRKAFSKFNFYPLNETGLCTALVLTIGLTIIFSTFRDYGVPWDDWIQSLYGKLVANYFSSGFQDKSCNDLADMKFYGPLFELIASLAFPSNASYPHFETRHLLIALTGLGTVVGVIQFARRFNLRLVPTFSALALIMMPQFYGYSFIDSKDIPLACAFTWFFVILCDLLTSSRISWGTVIASGLVYGMVFSIRPGSCPLIVMFTVFAFVYVQLTGSSPIPRWREENSPARLALKCLSVVSLAWGIMVLFWPWAHEHPIMNPVRAMIEAANFHNTYPVLFDGKIYGSSLLPWYYLPKIMTVTIPTPILLLAGIGLILGVTTLFRNSEKSLLVVLFLNLAWVIVPVMMAVIMRPNIYDGMRHFIFVLPGIALLAGYGATLIVAAAKKPLSRALCIAVIILALLQSVISIVKLHPYQYCFYNSLVGGLKGAAGKYETDYWVTSYKEAAEWINRNTHSNGPLNVLVAADEGSVVSLTYYLKDTIQVTEVFGRSFTGLLPAPYDYYVSTTRYYLNKNFDGAAVVGTFGREGAVFTVIKANVPK